MLPFLPQSPCAWLPSSPISLGYRELTVPIASKGHGGMLCLRIRPSLSRFLDQRHSSALVPAGQLQIPLVNGGCGCRDASYK